MGWLRHARSGALVAGTAVLVIAACTPAKPPTAQLRAAFFACTGVAEQWAVPAGVTAVIVDASGAAGGDGGNHVSSPDPLGEGGNGGRAVASLPVTPGEVLQVNVGCVGGNAGITSGAPGGFNGGGDGGDGGPDNGGAGGGGGGGGASDVRQGGAALAQRVVVGAGGAGGGGNCSGGECAPGNPSVDPGFGGDGGHPVGAKGGNNAAAGEGGTQVAGGTSQFGGMGGLNAGGNAIDNFGNNPGGGGGGSGLYGGGSGALGTGGGGGSSFGPSGAVFENGVRAGDGQVIVYWFA